MKDLQVIKNEIITIVTDRELAATAKLWVGSSVHLLTAAAKVLTLVVSAIIVLLGVARASLSTAKGHPVVVKALKVVAPVVAKAQSVATKATIVSAPVAAKVATARVLFNYHVTSTIDAIKPVLKVGGVFFANRPLVLVVAVVLAALTN